MSLIDSGVLSTKAREVTISETNSPPPYSRHSLRYAVLVIPAIGAKTTGMAISCLPYFRVKLTVYSLEDVVANLGQCDPLLSHGVALTDGYRLVVWSVKVDRDAERRAYLVLATIALADRPGLVVVHRDAGHELQELTDVALRDVAKIIRRRDGLHMHRIPLLDHRLGLSLAI